MSMSAEDERLMRDAQKDPRKMVEKAAELLHHMKINPPVNVLAATRTQFGHDYCIKGVRP